MVSAMTTDPMVSAMTTDPMVCSHEFHLALWIFSLQSVGLILIV